MSTHENKIDTSIGNLPERNATKLETTGTSIDSTNITSNSQRKEESIEKDTEKITKQEKCPIDKHGDTWGGGITGHNNQVK